MAAAKLAAPWTCSNIFSDPVLAKGFCPFPRTKCGASQDFDFGEVGEKTDISINITAGETCTYRIKADCGVPSFKPSTTDGFEIDNVDYDDDDLDESSRLRILQGKDNKGNNSWRSNRTKEERKSAGFKAEREIRRAARNMTIRRNQTDGAGKRGPKVAKFDPSAVRDGKQRYKGGKRNGTEPLCKPRYQQISVTALGNLTTSSRILQSDVYTMTLEIGSDDFEVSAGAFSLFFSASVLVFSLLAFF